MITADRHALFIGIPVVLKERHTLSMADGNVGPVGELSAAEAKQHKACTRGIFREREIMRLPSTAARTSKLCVRQAWFLGYLACMFAGMERSEAQQFMPRLDLLVHHPIFKDATAFLCRLAGYQAQAGHVPYVLGTEIVVPKYGAILYFVMAELLALAHMWRAACGGVITSFQDISFLAGMLAGRKDVLLAGCAAKGIEGSRAWSRKCCWAAVRGTSSRNAYPSARQQSPRWTQTPRCCRPSKRPSMPA